MSLIFLVTVHDRYDRTTEFQKAFRTVEKMNEYISMVSMESNIVVHTEAIELVE